ncbi:MAG: family acetyltransferase [Ferruginibacter sp.]|uniref:GNAT family N-acetyltransferase n=1 Tax=Ferruginibacter sp. TaxID=1940288 RepID=UPI0026591A9E|nr:GNAT family N-acetyltransferase [Ferruginibacter sp.]MDB5275547.1 family acetyltransferase [Ferruginibacter sp.]
MNNNNARLRLREAVDGDAKLLFYWANDDAVRNNSINQQPILWDDHIDWFNSKLNDANISMLILENDHVPVGQIRIALQDGCWNINYSIDRNYRGMGYGKQIVKLSIEKYPSYSFRAVVKKVNTASKKVFESLGFKSVYSADDSLYLYEHYQDKI